MTASDRPTVRLTVAQALVRYLAAQHSVADGRRRRLVPATLGIFGHGNVAGIGQALDQLHDVMPFVQGRNEQALVHAATAFAKATRRRAALAVTASSSSSTPPRPTSARTTPSGPWRASSTASPVPSSC